MLPTGSGGLSPTFLLLRTLSRRAAVPLLPALQRRAAGGKASAEDEKPVVYSTSKAAQWKAEQSFRSARPADVPEVQRWSVLASLVAFMVYFCILREENDFDQSLMRPLSDTIPGIDKVLPPTPAPAPRKWVPPAWRD
ncbi:uncharacterized protein LOC144101931 [Amblyomma americanum]|uniref:Protein CCSMST1 n=1 Tax=Amblyomma americanum TaxID=6943 RepID=A0AAQ4E642_AMBAM